MVHMLGHYLNRVAYCVIYPVSQHSRPGIILQRNSRMGPREAGMSMGRHSVVATIWKQKCFFSLFLLLLLEHGPSSDRFPQREVGNLGYYGHSDF